MTIQNVLREDPLEDLIRASHNTVHSISCCDQMKTVFVSATEVSGVVWETEVGIPTLRGLGMEPSQKVSLPVMDLNRLNSIILQFEQKIINKYTVIYLKLQ
jgi:hypothetical protein